MTILKIAAGVEKYLMFLSMRKRNYRVDAGINKKQLLKNKEIKDGEIGVFRNRFFIGKASF
ncbi:MAG: hypothetical protein WAW31_07940 [Smithella sp.]